MLSLFYILISMLSIQFGASLAKQLFPIAGPSGTTMLRVCLAALILLIIWRPWRIKFTSTQIKLFTGYGICLGAMNILFYLALARIPLGIAVALEFTGPLVLSLITSKKAIDIFWAILAGVGIYLVLPVSETNANALDLIGILLALAAGVFWALYIIFGQNSGKNTHSGHATAIGMTFAAFVTIPFGVYFNSAEVFQISILPLGLAIAVLSSALPYSLEMMAMKNISTTTFGVLMSLEPAIAALMGFLFLNENLTAIQIAAIACIIVASVGSAASLKNRSAPVPN
ncbi:MAG: EamA family transporter [Bdellovibrio sp.]|nr:EamA family transporter [Bdellovibrio sp.]